MNRKIHLYATTSDPDSGKSANLSLKDVRAAIVTTKASPKQFKHIRLNPLIKIQFSPLCSSSSTQPIEHYFKSKPISPSSPPLAKVKVISEISMLLVLIISTVAVATVRAQEASTCGRNEIISMDFDIMNNDPEPTFWPGMASIPRHKVGAALPSSPRPPLPTAASQVLTEWKELELNVVETE
ncbi:hypothetical protein BC829DRAFT_491486 [Chytridium lagenaria]|nr:hypothetical protein BC829DRAFT_491486 [Chytridium lagenaria]